MFNLKFSWQGAWSSAIQYEPFDAVVYNGLMYICVVVSTNNEPDTDAGAHWQEVSLRVNEHGPEVRTLTTQPISGSVVVSNFPPTYAVTQSTSPWVVDASSTTISVSGPLTDTQLRAMAVSVDASGATSKHPELIYRGHRDFLADHSACQWAAHKF